MMSEADRLFADRAIAIVLVALVVGLLSWRWIAFWGKSFRYLRTYRPPGRVRFLEFSALTPQLKSADKADAMAVLVERIGKLYDDANDGTKVQEAKASTILGFVGGGAGLYALAVESKAAAHPSFTWLIAIGITFLALTLVGTLLGLVGRPRRGLDTLRDEFADPLILNDPATTKARVAGYLFIKMLDRYDDFRGISLVKAFYIEAAQMLFAFGVISLVANYGVLVSGKKLEPTPSSVHCTVPAAAGKQTSVDCTITGGTP
jgi:hypothetical protein